MSLTDHDDDLATRVREAFAAERPTTGVDALVERGRAIARHRRLAVPLVAAAAIVAVLIGVVTIVAPAARRHSPTGPGAPAASSPMATACRALMRSHGMPVPGAPSPPGSVVGPLEPRLSTSVDGIDGIVYANRSQAFLCAGTSTIVSGSAQGPANYSLVGPGVGADLTVGDVANFTVPSGGPSATAFFGRVPEGTSALSIRLSDGTVAPVAFGQGIYLYVTTHGRPDMAQLTARGTFGTYVVGPFLDALPAAGPAAACANRVADVLAHAPGLTAGQRRATHPTVDVLDRPGEFGTTVLQGGDTVAAVCAGWTRVWFPATPFSAQPDVLTDIAPGYVTTPDGVAGFIFGHAPAGTQRVDLVMGDGTTHPTTLDPGGFYSAYWLTGAFEIARIVAVTPDTIYTLSGGQQTVTPR